MSSPQNQPRRRHDPDHDRGICEIENGPDPQIDEVGDGTASELVENVAGRAAQCGPERNLWSTILKSIDVDTPNGMAFSPDSKQLYVSNAFAGTVQRFALDTGTQTKSAMVGGLPGYIALLPDAKQLYMVRPDGETVEVLDADTLMITNTITVQLGPSTVCVCREP